MGRLADALLVEELEQGLELGVVHSFSSRSPEGWRALPNVRKGVDDGYPMPRPAVHLIADRRLVADLPGAVRRALAGLPPGVAAVHLREKDLGGRDLLALAWALRAACQAAGQLLLVNDRIDVALAAGADGVHLPSSGLPPAEARRLVGRERLVGVSCHGLAEVARARDGGADYATFGPLYDTPSKRGLGRPLGLGALEEAARLGLPLVGLGGIDAGRAAAVRAAGAQGVAAIRAWLAAPDPAAAVRALLGTT
jgi:thiamine-phosphate pyrophosphorylase